MPKDPKSRIRRQLYRGNQAREEAKGDVSPETLKAEFKSLIETSEIPEETNTVNATIGGHQYQATFRRTPTGINIIRVSKVRE